MSVYSLYPLEMTTNVFVGQAINGEVFPWDWQSRTSEDENESVAGHDMWGEEDQQFYQRRNRWRQFCGFSSGESHTTCRIT